MTTITTRMYGPGSRVQLGDHWTIDGVDIGRVESLEGDLFGDVELTIIPSLLFAAREVEWLGKIEGLQRHLTSEQMPGHDPPVAWRSGNWTGFPLIAYTGDIELAVGREVFGVVPGDGWVPHDVPILDEMPGKR